MSTAIAERPTTAPAVTAEQVALIRRTVAADATPDELQLYLYDCGRQGVHPLDNLLYFTKRKGKYRPVTSIDFMRIRAADSGECAGIDDAQFSGTVKGPDFQATVTVWRLVQGIRCAFTATARWTEYKPEAGNDFMWLKMPHTMLGKCAEAAALRKGFPRQLSGLYAKEEMDQADNAAPQLTPVADVVDSSAVVDVDTGEELITPPDGYHYVTAYRYQKPWHEAQILRYDLQGGTLRVSTKRDTIGRLLSQAADERIPMKVLDVTMKDGRPGEAYLNKCELWKPPPTDAELDAEILRQEQARAGGDVL